MERKAIFEIVVLNIEAKSVLSGCKSLRLTFRETLSLSQVLDSPPSGPLGGAALALEELAPKKEYSGKVRSVPYGIANSIKESLLAVLWVVNSFIVARGYSTNVYPAMLDIVMVSQLSPVLDAERTAERIRTPAQK